MNKKSAFKLGTVFLFALLVRLCYVALDSHGLDEIDPRFDSHSYHSIAVNLLEHGRYETEEGLRAARMPGYPLFIALIYAVCGKSVLAIQLAQCFIGALTCVFLVIASGRLVPPLWAWGTGFAAAIYYDLFAGCARVLSEPLYIFFVSIFFVVWLTQGEQSKRRAFMSGCVIGMCGLVRPEAWVFVFLIAVYLFFRPPLRRGIAMAFIFCASVAFFVGAWTLRNYRVFHQFIPTTSRVGASLYYGVQHSLTELKLAPVETLNIENKGELSDYSGSFSEAKKVYRKSSWLLILKVGLYGISIMLYPFHPWYDWTMVFCLPLWICGMVFIWRRHNTVALTPAAYVFIGTLIYISVGGVTSRYREPLAPGILLLAVTGAFHLHETYGTILFKRGALAWLSINLLVWFSAPSIRSALHIFKGTHLVTKIIAR